MIKIGYIKVNFEDEEEEFERTCLDFGDAKKLKENLQFLSDGYKTAKLVDVTESIWKKIDNTDSYITKTFNLVMRAIVSNGPDGRRTIDGPLKEIISGKVRAPIVLKTKTGYYLIAGNTRLMVLRALGLTPKVVLINSDW